MGDNLVLGSAKPKYASLRYVKQGRVDDGGQLPAGWGLENLTDVEVVDIDMRPQAPGLSCKFSIDPAFAGEYAGLALGDYASIEEDEPFALSAQVDLGESDGITEVYLLIREWVGGGEYIGQATRLAEMDTESASTLVVRTGRATGHVVRPALLFRRRLGAPAGGTITIRKLLFGSLYQHPDWLIG